MRQRERKQKKHHRSEKESISLESQTELLVSNFGALGTFAAGAVIIPRYDENGERIKEYELRLVKAERPLSWTPDNEELFGKRLNMSAVYAELYKCRNDGGLQQFLFSLTLLHRMEPDSVDILLLLAYTLFDFKYYWKTITVIKKRSRAIPLNRFILELHVEAIMGQAQVKEDVNNAIRVIEQAKEELPDTPESWVSIGVSYAVCGGHSRAIQVLAQAVAAKPDNKRAVGFLAYSIYQQGLLESLSQAQGQNGQGLPAWVIERIEQKDRYPLALELPK